jgi:transcription initiation factor TFIID subunit 5
LVDIVFVIIIIIIIIIIGEDLAINLWDLGSGKRIKKMTGHTASIYSLAFSAESSLLVSGGADWTVRCWDVMSAGGTAEKAADASSVSMGLSNGDTAGGATKEYGGDDGLQTCVCLVWQVASFLALINYFL